ncbi:MAG: hypothetical protein MRJ68_09365 [Nitrospira sp.]|nr:hypothetical protein [Nitrospira sp.]
MKHFLKVIVISLLVMGCVPDKKADKQTSIFEISGRTFEMPTAYIQSDLEGKRIQDEGVNLVYVLPEFKSHADIENSEEYEEAKKSQRFAHMLIEPLGIKAPLEIGLQNLRSTVEKVEKLSPMGNLERELWYRIVNGKVVPYYEVYIERDRNGDVISYINCATFESGSHVKAPGCSHLFVDKKIFYDIYYNKDNYLRDWENQKRAAINFINKFEISSSSESQGYLP